MAIDYKLIRLGCCCKISSKKKKQVEISSETDEILLLRDLAGVGAGLYQFDRIIL